MTQQGDSGLQRKPELRLALLSGSGGMYLAQVPEHATTTRKVRNIKKNPAKGPQALQSSTVICSNST